MIKHSNRIAQYFDFKFVLTICILSPFLKTSILHAQITVDPSTGTNIVTTGNQTTINGGSSINGYLLHRFQDFNVQKNTSVYFANPQSNHTIINSVIGSSHSNISGTIGTIGNANIVLINPNGIRFFNGANFDIQGSFTASTANSIDFSNQNLVLKFNANNSSIYVEGNGHNRIFSGDSRIANFYNGPVPSGLDVPEKENLNFIGGNIVFDGGIATAPSGSINLISVKNGSASIYNPNSPLKISSSIEQSGNVSLVNRSFINASGIENGFIFTKANNLTISDASLIHVENFGMNAGGLIDIEVSNLTINGITQKTPLFPFSFDAYVRGISSVGNTGNGPDIRISANTIDLFNQGNITSNAEGSGDGGNISLDVKGSINIEGATPFNPFLPFGSYIGTLSRGSGKAGDIKLTSKNLYLSNGGNLQSVVLNSGNGGNVKISVRDDIILNGFTPFSNIPSIISTISVGNLTSAKSGDGGILKIKAKRIVLDNGGRIDASTLADGNAGSLDIEADSIQISGGIPGDESSQIISSASSVNQFLKSGFSLNEPTGDSGSVLIQSNNLNLFDSGSINVRSDGPGDAGKIRLNIKEKLIIDDASISAFTRGGSGGSLEIQAPLIQLKNARLLASSIGLGDGGNISISSDLLITREQTRIEANSLNRNGGNININAEGGLFGPETIISASSALGSTFDGTVDIDTTRDPIINDDRIVQIAQPKISLAELCSSGSASVTKYGKGPGAEIISDSRLLAAASLKKNLEYQSKFVYVDPDTGEEKPFKRWLGVKKREDGLIEFVTDPSQSKGLQNLLSSLEDKCKAINTS